MYHIILRNCYLRNLRINDPIRCRHFRYDRHSLKLNNSVYKHTASQPYTKLTSAISSNYFFTNNTLIEKKFLQNYDVVNYYSLSIIRPLSLSAWRFDKEPLKPSSKLEVTVKALKDEQKQEITNLPVQKPQKSLKERFVEECKHYYHGFRLLFFNIRTSTALVWRVLNGKSLTRREHTLLIRTVGDLFRLVPFSVFLIVPFLEFTLPFFIKFFPNMLPTTFQTAKEREDKLKANLKVKLEMAKFLQKTLDDMAVQHKDHTSDSAKEFAEWFRKVRTSGEEVSNEDIMRFSKLFQDEITLDSLTRGQLVALCRVLEVQTLGTNNLLRFQLRMKLRNLAADDKLIQKEGVNNLNVTELQNACKARGMRAYGLSEEMLRKQLNQWLDLSLDKKVPPALLLLSRALMLPDTIPTTDKLKATISSLPEHIVTHTTAAIAETEGKIDNKIKLEVLKEEVRKVKEERQERREERKRQEKEEIIDKAPIIEAAKTEELRDPAEVITNVVAKKEEHISSQDLEMLEDALDTVAKKKLLVEKEVIEDLKEEMADYQEDVQELKQVSVAKPEFTESKAAKRLFARVNKMIQKMDKVVDELETKEKQLKKEMADGVTVKKEELIRIDELLDAIRKMQKVPDKSVTDHVEKILAKIDDDHDGSIKVDDVLKVIEVIGKENVRLSEKQMDDVIELIDKEDILEVEDKIEKALLKDAEQKEEKKKQKELLKASSTEQPKSIESSSSNNGNGSKPKKLVLPASSPPPISIDPAKKGTSDSKML